MTLAHEHLDPIAVLDAVIADMRASGDTGHVENLLQAKSDFLELVDACKRHELAFEQFMHGDIGDIEFADAQSRIWEVARRIGSAP